MVKRFKFKFNIRKRVREYKLRFSAYIKRLLFPIYFFPIKLLTYSAYYLVLFSIKAIIKSIKLSFYSIIWPFRSWTNFGKTVLWGLVIGYLVFTEIRITAIVERYGGYRQLFCSQLLTSLKVKNSVVRVVGGYSEGSGFFITSDQVLTNFHVIDGEPSPKVIFPDGHFVTPTKITGNKDADLALLYLPENHPGKLMKFIDTYMLQPNEPILSVGYPLGTSLSGEATIVKGHYISRRAPSESDVEYLQTDISLVEGMSGGPTINQCGDVIGVNTLSLAGLSLVVSSDSLRNLWPTFTDQEIAKIEVDPSRSPADAVTAFYTYLKARRMQDGFNLLSKKYLEKTNIQEWTSRFTDILDVTIYLSEEVEGEPDKVFVKFSTKNWVNGEAVMHYYEGTWETVFEDGVYKMNRSNIKEVEGPGWEWFYE